MTAKHICIILILILIVTFFTNCSNSDPINQLRFTSDLTKGLNIIEGINDQKVLRSIVYDFDGKTEAEYRRKALSRITDNQLLLGIALKSDYQELRISALNKLNDQRLLLELNALSQDSIISELAHEKITDPDLIEILNSFNSVPDKHQRRIKSMFVPGLIQLKDSIMIKIIGRISSFKSTWYEIKEPYYVGTTYNGSKPGEVFKYIFMLNKNKIVISHTWKTDFPINTGNLDFLPSKVSFKDLFNKIINRLNQKDLSQIAAADIEWSLRVMAAQSITDQFVITDLIFSCPDINSLQRKYSETQYGLKNMKSYKKASLVDIITDQSILEKIVTENNAGLIRCAAAEKITNLDFLEKLAVEDEDGDVRYAAAEKITNEDILKKLVDKDKSIYVKCIALSKIVDQDFLVKFVKSKEESIRYNAVLNFNDRFILEDILKKDKSERIKELAYKKLISFKK